jgi:hypothetical protein
MALPCGTTGSLCSSFLPDRLVSLPVKHPYAITLYDGYQSAEGTFRSLRYTFGGDHPSQTTHQTVSSLKGVRIQIIKGPYFKDDSTNPGVPASKSPTYPTHQLPKSMLSYSKGSRGLFVPLRVIGIFTDTTISPSSRLRQCPDRYTIRAGRNLPDKEFRYLRTVIVTAAVYWGFNSMLLLR